MRITELSTHRTPLQPNVCLLTLRTDDGRTGLGETFWGADAVEAYLHGTAAPLLAHVEDATPAAVQVALRPYVGYASSGAETRGIGAIDIALWDLLGQAAGRSVARLLGGPLAPRLRVYNTCAGYAYVAREDRQATDNWGIPATAAADRPYEDLAAFMERPAELARSLLAEGYTAMKVWPFDPAAEATRGGDLPYAALREGMRVLEAIRGAVGDAMDILVELHGLWSVKGAVTLLRELETIRPWWVEDPIRPDAPEAYRMLRERTSVPIAAGETLTGRRGFKPLLDAGALDVAIVDVGWTGGISEAVKVAALADTYGVGFAPHDCTGPVSFAVTTQVAAAQPNAVIAETVRAFTSDWYRRIADGVPEVRDGHVTIGEAPGLGVRLRDDFLARPDTQTRTTRIG
ncbi:MAG: mandelate racemase/muconate lactonizing enzyme family protein [Chloroflexota bacterium]